MQFIQRNDFKGKTHAVSARERIVIGDAWAWQAVTFCGRTVIGRSGECIAPLIDCERCRASMRKVGWEV